MDIGLDGSDGPVERRRDGLIWLVDHMAHDDGGTLGKGKLEEGMLQCPVDALECYVRRVGIGGCRLVFDEPGGRFPGPGSQSIAAHVGGDRPCPSRHPEVSDARGRVTLEGVDGPGIGLLDDILGVVVIAQHPQRSGIDAVDRGSDVSREPTVQIVGEGVSDRLEVGFGHRWGHRYQNTGWCASVAHAYCCRVSGCCDPSGYEGMFNDKVAARSARSFSRKGLDATARPMVDALAERGLDDCSVLEIGAGSGTALVSLLDSGAQAAFGVDISPAYEQVAAQLLQERGYRDAVQWRTGDFVSIAPDIDDADVVFGNRVVCCYPAMEAMVDTAAGKARRFLALAYPRDRWLSHIIASLINFTMKLRRNSFRTYVHDPRAIAERVARAGFVEAAAGVTPQWHWYVWEATA